MMNEQISYHSAKLQNILNPISNRPTTKIIAVGGGKGGVGKTSFTVMLGIFLANANKKTVYIIFCTPHLLKKASKILYSNMRKI